MQCVWGPEGCCACRVLSTRHQCGQYKHSTCESMHNKTALSGWTTAWSCCSSFFSQLYFLKSHFLRHSLQLSHLKRQHGSLLAHPLPSLSKRQWLFSLLKTNLFGRYSVASPPPSLPRDPCYPACISRVQASPQNRWQKGQQEKREWEK